MLELIIGDFGKPKEVKEYGNHWKFILAKEEQTIFLYTGALHLGEKFCHATVVSKNNVPQQNVLGGGEITYNFGTATIDGMSGDFGIVPNSIMEKFAKPIGEELETEYEIKKIEIDMWYDPGISEKKSPQHIEMWNKLGYEFDNQKRDIGV